MALDRAFWMKAAGVSGATAVLLGAFGAHSLRGRVTPREMEGWRTAASYHLIHSVALLGVASASPVLVPRGTTTARLFAGGIILFSGSVYATALGYKKFGMHLDRVRLRWW